MRGGKANGGGGRTPGLAAWPLAAAALLAAAAAPAQGPVPEPAPGTVLFHESFEDTLWASRGWYDGPHMEIDVRDDAPEGRAVDLWRWPRAGAVSPVGGAARVALPPVTDVSLSFAIRFAADWSWTGVPYHPHMFHFLTNQDDDYVGPAWTRLTTYVEIVNGVPRLTLQDGRNVDTARVRQDLTGITEARAVAGCNGDADGHGAGDCYRSGDEWRNGKLWSADRVWFGDEPGPYDKSRWHRVRARFRLNSVVDGRARRDGVLQMWIDEVPVIDVRDAELRTGEYPGMRFDQFLMAPYYGPGVPHAQRAWVDDLRITATAAPAPSAVPETTWGDLKRGPR